MVISKRVELFMVGTPDVKMKFLSNNFRQLTMMIKRRDMVSKAGWVKRVMIIYQCLKTVLYEIIE